ncbi:hypothetical protein E4T48_07548 [Aureobasidium sp. EXF-10727]|nr:hypothetical protein E4T48_07548 [Aureobasidium sp. EXF-10727]
MSPAIDYEKVVPAMLELTDSIIRLLNATSHREGCSKHTISALRTLIVRERKTIQRQNTTIVNLRKRLLDVEEQLMTIQQGLKSTASVTQCSSEDGDEKVDLSSMAELQKLDESPRQEVNSLFVGDMINHWLIKSQELSAQAAASTLYDLQNIYSRMAERYAADLEMKAEEDGESEWAEDA